MTTDAEHIAATTDASLAAVHEATPEHWPARLRALIDARPELAGVGYADVVKEMTAS